MHGRRMPACKHLSPMPDDLKMRRSSSHINIHIDADSRRLDEIVFIAVLSMMETALVSRVKNRPSHLYVLIAGHRIFIMRLVSSAPL